MKPIIFIILFSTCVSCTSKKDNELSIVQNESSEKEAQKKLSADEIMAELERLNFFNLTDESELEEVKAAFQKSYTELNFFQGKTRGETLDFMDNRYFYIDCEELFEAGGITKYLEKVQRTFKKLGLKLEFAKEKSLQTSSSWNHTIELNGTKYIAFDSTFSNLDWGIAYVNFLKMLNAELRKQNSAEQFYPISCGNDGAFILLTSNQFDFVHKNYPIDDEHPSTLTSWKSRNGL